MKICYILILLANLNAFAQDFEEQYHRYYPDSGDTITPYANQYGFKTKQGKLTELVVKTVIIQHLLFLKECKAIIRMVKSTVFGGIRMTQV